MRKLNYLIIVMMIAAGLFITSCEKDQDVQKQQMAEVSFGIDLQQDFDFKEGVPVPECIPNAMMDHVIFILNDGTADVSYNSPVIWVNGMPKTKAVKLYVGDDGASKIYTLTSFLVYDAGDVLIMAAPHNPSTYWDLMVNRLNIDITVEAFKKQEVIIDVLCFEQLLYEYFGFVWFELNEVVIERQCFFGDLCIYDAPAEMLTDLLLVYPDQMDVVAKMKIEVHKDGDANNPIRTFKNINNDGSLIEGQCMEVYWANDIDKPETFTFNLFVLVGPDNWLEVATYEFDDDNCPLEGGDGVTDFVVGNCGNGGADYTFDWDYSLPYVYEDNALVDDPPPANTFTDPRDGQVYATVVIGTQTWFAENLNYETTTGSWWYDNLETNGAIYGRLYTWDAAMVACPSGYHLPTDEEWKTMEMALGMSQSEADDTGYRGTNEGEKMKSTSGWYNNGNGTNSSGFNALPGGYRYYNGSFYHLGINGYWWSSTEGSGTLAWYRSLHYYGDQVNRNYYYKTGGYSVRCIKN